MVLSENIDSKNVVEKGKEAINNIKYKAEKISNKNEFTKSVKEGVKKIIEKLNGRKTFHEGIEELDDKNKLFTLPKDIKDILKPENLKNKEKIKRLQNELRPNYNPSHTPTFDGVPGVFTLGALLNKIGGYSNIEKVEYKGTSENKEEYTNFIGTLPKEVVDQIKIKGNEDIKALITGFESGNLTPDIVKKAQTALSDSYLGHKSSGDGIPGQNTQNAILNYALSLK